MYEYVRAMHGSNDAYVRWTPAPAPAPPPPPVVVIHGSHTLLPVQWSDNRYGALE